MVTEKRKNVREIPIKYIAVECGETYGRMKNMEINVDKLSLN